MNKILVRTGEFIITRRMVLLILILLATAVFGWKVANVRMESITTDLFPKDHPYVETYVKYQDIFGGANVVIMDIEVKEGDIFNLKTLEKIRKITKELELMPGINNYQVLSLAQRKVKKITVDPQEGYQAIPIMWPHLPENEEDIKKLVRTVHTIPNILGSLVSLDKKAALIVAGFFEDKMDTKEVYRRLHALIMSESDENTSLHAIGRPVLLGFILSKYSQLIYLFIGTIAAIILVLFVYFRDFRGVFVPMITAIISAVWGIGMLGFMNYNFDPLIIVAPFVISARALSHSVQLIERFLEEYAVHKERKKAAVNTFIGLFEPGIVSIVTDAAGVFVVILTPIPLMEKLAVMGGFWVISIIVSDMVLNPIILSFLPAPTTAREKKEDFMDRLLKNLALWSTGKGRWAIIGVTLVIFIAGYIFASRLVVGDMYPGTPMLWPGSKYNLDTAKIGEKFNNTEVMSVVVEGNDRNAIKHPEVLNKMANLQRDLEQMPEVGGTASIADFIPNIIMALHGGDPKWELIPVDHRESGFFLELIYSGSEPGDLTRFVTQDSKSANIAIYLRDHKGETLKKVVDKVKDFVAANPMENAQFLLAGGYGGLLAAVNEVITNTQAMVTAFAFFFVFICCMIAYKSLFAGFLFLIPLAISNYLTYALMGLLGIGLDVNALPVVSIGVGLGVDYGLYIVSRIKEEFAICGDLRQATLKGISTAGKAVLFTASTMVAGIVFWVFSFLKFQAVMGLLLVFWMVLSMLGGLVLLPVLIVLIKPKFVTG